MKAISTAQLNSLLSHLDSGKSNRQVALSTGLSVGTVSNYRQLHRPTLPKDSGGRPPHLSSHDKREALRLINTGKAANAVQATRQLQDITSQTLNIQTVRRALRKDDMVAVVKRKRPMLTAQHRKRRLHFAEAHLQWTEDDWKRVVWSDETKINRINSDGRVWVWKKKGEAFSDRMVIETKKFGGGSLMVWGCMTWDGPGFICKIDGKMDAELYISILDEDLLSTLEYYGLNHQDIIFQQDNDPKHTSKKASSWFKDHDFDVMEWPAQSPDLNPIEHLWSHLKRRLAQYEEPPAGVHELWERVQKEWEGIPKEVCQNLISSMPRRVAAVIKAQGGHTKY